MRPSVRLPPPVYWAQLAQLSPLEVVRVLALEAGPRQGCWRCPKCGAMTLQALRSSTWHCGGCGWRGDVLALARLVWPGLSITEATRRLLEATEALAHVVPNVSPGGTV